MFFTKSPLLLRSAYRGRALARADDAAEIVAVLEGEVASPCSRGGVRGGRAAFLLESERFGLDVGFLRWGGGGVAAGAGPETVLRGGAGGGGGDDFADPAGAAGVGILSVLLDLGGGAGGCAFAIREEVGFGGHAPVEGGSVGLFVETAYAGGFLVSVGADGVFDFGGDDGFFLVETGCDVGCCDGAGFLLLFVSLLFFLGFGFFASRDAFGF